VFIGSHGLWTWACTGGATESLAASAEPNEQEKTCSHFGEKILLASLLGHVHVNAMT
jgi:hypothetical protein